MKIKVRSTPKPSARKKVDDQGKTYRVSEDAYVINDDRNLFAVLDGASGQGGLPGDVAAQTVKKVIEDIQPDESLHACVKRANQELAEVNVREFAEIIDKLVDVGKLTSDFRTRFEQAKSTIDKLHLIPKHFLSATTIAAVELTKDGKLHWVHAGDAMLAYQQADKEGTVKIVTEDRVSITDHRTYLAQQKAWDARLQEMKEREGFKDQEDRKWFLSKFFLSEKRKSKGSRVNLDKIEELKTVFNEIRQELKPVKSEGRDRANNAKDPDWYSVIDGTPEAEDFLVAGTIDMKQEQIKHIGLLTDGYAMPMRRLDETGNVAWKNSFRYLFKHGIDKLFALVHELESRDPVGILFRQRSKQHDDRTAILITDVRTKEKSHPQLRDDAYREPAIAEVVRDWTGQRERNR